MSTSPLEALRTATYNPASYLGALDSLGTIGEGKIADLVLLDADPLEDIRNTRRISAVIAATKAQFARNTNNRLRAILAFLFDTPHIRARRSTSPRDATTYFIEKLPVRSMKTGRITEGGPSGLRHQS